MKYIAGSFIVLLLVLAFVLSGCVTPDKPFVTNDSNFSQAGLDQVVQGNNNFGFNLYNELSKTENQFFSPYSITAAFAIVGEASKNNTKAELDSVFGYPGLELRRPAFANIYNSINTNSSEYKLSTANAIWVNNGFSLLQEYVNNAETYYGAKLDNIDFSKSAEAVEIINSWVENQTNNKIKDIISKDFIDNSTRIVIANAIYFKGKWEIAFENKNTTKKEFTNDLGQVSKVNMMSLHTKFNYFEDDQLQVIELPYKGNNLSMVVVLPKTDLESLAGFNNTQFNEIVNNFAEETVNLSLPKFKLEITYNKLKDQLGNLGLKEVFTENADLSGFTGIKNLFVSDVIHKAFVEVNEEGTEAAAAATVIGIKMTATSINEKEPKVFNANHPFMFFIIDNKTNNILFFGSVVDPKS